MADSISIDIVTGKNEVKDDLKEIGKLALSLGGPMAKLAIAAAAAGAAIAGVVIHKSIKAAAEYEEAVNALNVALNSSGQFSKAASEGMRSFADELQKTTKFSDDQVLSTATLIQNLGRLSVDALKPATKAAMDLSAALGMDLTSAASLVGKAANGNVAAFARYGIEIKKGATDTETFANALSKLQQRFGGASEAAANSFSGANAKMKNAFDDIFKEIGRAITKSPAIVLVIKEISGIFSKIADAVKKSIGTTDFFKSFVINFAVVAQAGAETARRIGLSFELAFLRAQQAWAAFKVATTLGASDAFQDQLIDINARIDETKAKFSEDSSITLFFDNLITKISETSGKLNEFTTGLTGMPGTVEPALTAFQEQLDSLAASVRQKLVSGISAGIQAVVGALKTGGNAFKAFGQQILVMLGDMAIQIGETLLLTGIGMEAVRQSIVGLTGGPAIMMGIALIAFGALLKSMGGGGGASAGASAGGGSSGGSSTGSAADVSGEDVSQLEPQKPQTNITVAVQGNILDRRQTGLEIAEVIQETFGTNGINYTTA